LIYVRLGGSSVAIEREVFTALLGRSAMSGRAAYLKALESSDIGFDDLVALARKAEIPYSLFFAPRELVEAQLSAKTAKLLAGISKQAFSMNSRSTVRLQDVELIVKDLLRKQEELKRRDGTLVANPLVGRLRASRDSVAQDAEVLRSTLGFSVADIRDCGSKQAALDLLVGRFEARQLLVSQSQQHYMPQQLPRGVKFSGLCVRDKKIPYIFLTGGDQDENPEPAGRKLFTLVLLAVLVARGRFAPVTYSDQTSEPLVEREYELAEEVLMPADELCNADASSLDALKDCADSYRVTPSALAMRVRRLGVISRLLAESYLEALAQEFAARPKPIARAPKSVNAVRRYAGAEVLPAHAPSVGPRIGIAKRLLQNRGLEQDQAGADL
jgi:hypothetical protein